MCMYHLQNAFKESSGYAKYNPYGNYMWEFPNSSMLVSSQHQTVDPFDLPYSSIDVISPVRISLDLFYYNTLDRPSTSQPLPTTITRESHQKRKEDAVKFDRIFVSLLAQFPVPKAPPTTTTSAQQQQPQTNQPQPTPSQSRPPSNQPTPTGNRIRGSRLSLLI